MCNYDGQKRKKLIIIFVFLTGSRIAFTIVSSVAPSTELTSKYLPLCHKFNENNQTITGIRVIDFFYLKQLITLINFVPFNICKILLLMELTR